MTDAVWVCETCGVEHAAAVGDLRDLRRRATVGAGEWQRWATLADLARPDGVSTSLNSGRTCPGSPSSRRWGSVNSRLLVRTDAGTLLWDPVGYLDADVREPGSGAGRGHGDRRQPPAHVRGSGRVEQGPRWCSGARLRGGRGLGCAAGRRDQDLVRTLRGRSGFDPASARRPLPRGARSSTGRRGRPGRRAVRLGHDPRESRSLDVSCAATPTAFRSRRPW